MKDGITIQVNVPEIEKLIPKITEFFEKFDGGQVVTTVDEIMTGDDICQEFKIPKSKLYNLTMQTGPGSIPRFKIGRDLRFKRVEVAEWFNQQRV